MSLSFKQWRLVKELTQEDMAQKIGVHVNTYRAWEKNPEEITLKNARKIAGALEVPPDQIFFIEEVNNV